MKKLYKPESGWSGFLIAGTLVLGAGVTGALIFLITNQSGLSNTPEVQTGVLIVLAVSVLAFLLFILTAGFRALGLADEKQALGLPSGSVRAFIALMLIMIFVILSVYTTRVVGEGVYTYLGTISESDSTDILGTEGLLLSPRDDNLYDVFQTRPLTSEGIALANQLITTIATLVVAVSSFYFGSGSVDTALKATGATAAARKAGLPLIRSISPITEKTGESVTITITGRNLSNVESVELVKENESLKADQILSNSTTVQCRVKLDKAGKTQWNIVVKNADGEKDELENAFEILESTGSV